MSNHTLERRILGRTGFEVSVIGFGAWGIGGNQWRGHTEDEALQALRRALELGIDFIDTALAYNEGHSERLIGQVLRESGTPPRVATKIPPKNRVWPATKQSPMEEVFPYEYIVASTEASLKNLGVESLDLQQFHVWTDAWASLDGWKRAIEDLRRSGKVRAFGISVTEHDPDSVLEACATGLIDTVQVVYNIFDQKPELNLYPLCEELNIGVIARCPFDEGSLTGDIRPDSTFDPGEFRATYFRGDRPAQVSERINLMSASLTALAHDEPVADTALRFSFTHSAVSTSIPGMRRVRNVERNLAAAAKGGLPESIVELLRRHAWEKNFYQ
jgi:aryl-alcohol dehydrogenase-like predicted oxidoreductase